MQWTNLIPGNKSLRRLALASSVAAVSLVLASAFASSLPEADKYKTLYRFKGVADGADPTASLIFDAAGNLYGTTYSGGDDSNGTVFELMPTGDGFWKKVLLHAFTGGENGSGPYAGLTFDSHGNLYGTAGGGTYSSGTVFELMPKSNGSWTLKILHSFNRTDGWDPIGNLIFDTAGNLYGTTNNGGAHFGGGGTVFELTPKSDGSWKERVLHSFSINGGDGYYPFTGVILDQAGNLYGTTSVGGPNSSGTVFELTPQSDGNWKESIIHSFSNNGEDGYYPVGGVIFDAAGSLYGTTAGGGGGNICGQFGCGIVFELTPIRKGIWKESILYDFKGGNYGSRPTASLVLDSAGSLYSTTANGGTYNFGTVFALKPNGKHSWGYVVLHSFRDHPGALPNSGLVLDTHGRLYGTTQGDFDETFGSVFEIAP